MAKNPKLRKANAAKTKDWSVVWRGSLSGHRGETVMKRGLTEAQAKRLADRYMSKPKNREGMYYAERSNPTNAFGKKLWKAKQIRSGEYKGQYLITKGPSMTAGRRGTKAEAQAEADRLNYNLKNPRRGKGKVVKVSGHTVREGTKKWERLVAQRKQFEDLSRHEKNPRVAKMTQGAAVAEIFRRHITGPKKYEVLIQRDHIRRAKTFASFPAAQAWARLTLHDVVHNPAPSAADLLPGGSTIQAWADAGHRVVKGVAGAAKTGFKKVKKLVKKNPLELAQQRHEEFTGFPSEETLELTQRQHVHSNLTGLAQFVSLNLVGVDGRELPPMIAPGMSYKGPQEEILLSFKGKPTGDWRFDPKTAASKIVWLTASEQIERDGKEIKQQLYLSGGDQRLDNTALKFFRIEARDMHDNMLIGTIKRVWYWTRKTFEADGKERVWFFHDFGKEGSDGICPVLIYHPLDPSFEIAGGRYYIALPRRDLKGVRGGNVSPGIVG
jgi:hypothetical protein